jgi:histidyl-tRNA synthetase
MKVAKEWRDKGETVTIVATDKRLGDKLNYAAKIAKKAIVLGDNEVKTGIYEIKEFN